MSRAVAGMHIPLRRNMHIHGGFAQVEYKAFGFEASGAWAAALDGCGRPQQGSGRQQLPVLPAAFEIATSAALVLGKDLATLLPPDAGIPRPVVLPSLAEVRKKAWRVHSSEPPVRH